MKASSTIQQFAAAPAATIATAVQAERPRAGEPSVRLGSLLAERAREAESLYAFLYFTRGEGKTVYYAPPGALVHADARLCRSSGAQAGVLALAKVCGGSGAPFAPATSHSAAAAAPRAMVFGSLDDVFGPTPPDAAAGTGGMEGGRDKGLLGAARTLARRIAFGRGAQALAPEAAERIDEIAGLLANDGYESEWAFRDNEISCYACGGAMSAVGMQVFPIESSGDVHYLCGTCIPRVNASLRRIEGGEAGSGRADARPVNLED